ncbi:MAG TPA: hypothetical protein PLH99_11080 [Proteiniphilum sp.]|nr:hypothetical protein [Proteiniphilum sp.]
MGKKAAEPEISQLELAQKSARERLRFTQAQLNEYLERFPESHRETVYDYFVHSRILSQVLDTTQGKVILNDLIALMGNAQLHLIDTALDVGRGNQPPEAIVSICQKMDCYRDIMERWAKALSKGDEIEEELSKM